MKKPGSRLRSPGGSFSLKVNLEMTLSCLHTGKQGQPYLDGREQVCLFLGPIHLDESLRGPGRGLRRQQGIVRD